MSLEKDTCLPEDLRTLDPFDRHRLDVPGGKLAYVDEGPPEAPAIVCLHGNPTWSFYYRRLGLAFRERYRVIIVDHLGCGFSEKPQSGFSYRLEAHADNLRRLLDHLRLEDSTFVLHDWGGAIGMAVLTEAPERARAFVVLNTAAFPSKRIPLSIASVRVPLFGALMVRGLNAFARAALYRTTERGLSRDVKRGLLLPYRSWRDRIAILRFVEDIPMAEAHPSWTTLVRTEAGLSKLADRPMLVLWGDADFCFGPPFREEWSRRFPNADVRAWPDVGHYVMEDAPERVIAEMTPFLERIHR